jgi:hypothetical protein
LLVAEPIGAGKIRHVPAVPPAGVLPVGLSLLSALAQLCRSDSASLLERPARSL